MHTARIAGTVTAMAVGLIISWPTMANSANPVGNGFCDTPVPGSGDFCTGKNDSGAPWADWSGDNVINVFNDWRYSGFPTDSPNDDGEYAINGDSQAQRLYEDPFLDPPFSCFPTHYVSSDMQGREDNDSSLSQLAGGSC